MNPHRFLGFVGVIERDGSRDPTVIIGASAHQIRQTAIGFLVRDPTTAVPPLSFDGPEDLNDFLTTLPVPDLGDAFALMEWFAGMREAMTAPLLTIFGPKPDPHNGVGTWHPASEPIETSISNSRRLVRRPTPPCPCDCNSGGWCGGCGHAGCAGRRRKTFPR